MSIDWLMVVVAGAAAVASIYNAVLATRASRAANEAARIARENYAREFCATAQNKKSWPPNPKA